MAVYVLNYFFRIGTILVFLVLFNFLSVLEAVAQDVPGDVANYGTFEKLDAGVDPTSAFPIPGENFDSRTGTINHEVVDYTVTGTNGLNIILARSFAKTNFPRWDVGWGWDFEVPRLLLHAMNRASSTCNYVSLGRLADNGFAKWQLEPVFSVTVPGQPSQDFTRNTGFPYNVGAEFVSSGGWTAKCTGPSNKNFLVRSPDGIRYLFDTTILANFYSTFDDSTKRGDSFMRVYASEMSDLYGNWVRYTYTLIHDYDYIRNIITQITASDGRVVDFQYTRRLFAPYYTSLGQKITDNYQAYLSGFIVRGETDKAFQYVTSNLNLDGGCQMINAGLGWVCYDAFPFLNKVRRPDGKTTDYYYKQILYSEKNISPSNPDSSHQRIYKIKFPNDLLVEYIFAFTRTLPFNRCDYLVQIAPLKAKKLSGPGIPTSATVNYEYYINGPVVDTGSPYYTYGANPYVKNSGDLHSYTFEYYDKPLIVRKFDRGNTSTCIGDEIAAKEKGLLFEQAVLPKPATVDPLSLYNYSLAEIAKCTNSSTQNNCLGDVKKFTYNVGAQWGSLLFSRTNNIWKTSFFGRARAASSQMIFRSSGTYKNEILQFSPLLNTELSREYSSANAANYRDKKYAYFSDFTNHIFEMVSEDTLVGVGSVFKTYSPTGQLLTANSFGITSRQDYYPNGELKGEYQIKDGIEIQLKNHQNYKLGAPQLTTMPLGMSISGVINNDGMAISQTDGEGNITTHTFDIMNRKVSTTPPRGAVIQYSYPTENMTVITRDRQKKTTYRDALGRVLEEATEDSITGKKIVTKSTYDNSGRLYFKSLPGWSAASNLGTIHEYDVLNRMTKRTDTTNGAVTSMQYLPGNQVVITKPGGTKSRFTFHSYGSPQSNSLVKIENELNAGALAANNSGQIVTTVISRDLSGKITSVNQEGKVRTYTYNANKLLASLTEPERKPIYYTYVPNTTLVASQQVGANTPIFYKYDDAFRRSVVDRPGTANDATFFYDKNGNVLSIFTPTVIREYTYDQSSNKTSETLKIDGKTFTSKFMYNELDQPIEIEYPNNSTIHGTNLSSSNTLTYTADAFGLPSAVKQSSGDIVSSADYYANFLFNSISYGNGAKTSLSLTSTMSPRRITVSTPATTTTAALIQNGVVCTSASQCSSGYCYAGPESKSYCIAASSNCAKPNTDGALYGEVYTYNSRTYQCTSGIGVNNIVDITNSSCTFNGQSVASGSSITAFLASSVPYGSTCSSQTRTCTNGVLSGTYTYSSCTVSSAAANCIFNGTTVLNGQSVTAYQTSFVPPCDICTSQTRTCTNGVLSGSYIHPSCTAQTGTCL